MHKYRLHVSVFSAWPMTRLINKQLKRKILDQNDMIDLYLGWLVVGVN